MLLSSVQGFFREWFGSVHPLKQVQHNAAWIRTRRETWIWDTTILKIREINMAGDTAKKQKTKKNWVIRGVSHADFLL